MKNSPFRGKGVKHKVHGARVGREFAIRDLRQGVFGIGIRTERPSFHQVQGSFSLPPLEISKP